MNAHLLRKDGTLDTLRDVQRTGLETVSGYTVTVDDNDGTLSIFPPRDGSGGSAFGFSGTLREIYDAVAEKRMRQPVR